MSKDMEREIESLVESKYSHRITSMCRLCLLKNGIISIFNDDSNIQASLRARISSCLLLEIFQGDGLPTLICGQCLGLVDKFYNFKEMCSNSNATLRKMLINNLEVSKVKLAEDNDVPVTNTGTQNTEYNSETIGNDNINLSGDNIGKVYYENMDSSDQSIGENNGTLKKYEASNARSSSESVSELLLENEDKSIDANTFNCKTCFKSFTKLIYLKKHELVHIKRKKYVCNKCEKSFPCSEDLSQHEKNCNAREILQDTEILFVSRHKNCNPRETLLDTNKISVFNCSVCLKTFKKRVYLKRHEVVHSKERPYTCMNCNISFSRTGDLAKHLRIHGTSKVPLHTSNKLAQDEKSCTFLCRVCSRSFTKECYLKQHEVVHSEESTYLCDQCGKSFDQRRALTQHKAIHNVSKSHLCNICNKTFAFLTRLKAHKKLHAGTKSYLCNTCGKGFVTKEGLLGHERTHTGDKPYKCSLCEKSFATSSNFRTHKRNHIEGKRFPCNTCGVSFFSRSGLERHERLHTGVKSFKCDVCSLAFYTKREVMRHELFHLGYKRFSCDRCNKSYYERHHLVIHQRIHTGERPFSCNYCKKSFIERSKLKRHLHIHKL